MTSGIVRRGDRRTATTPRLRALLLARSVVRGPGSRSSRCAGGGVNSSHDIAIVVSELVTNALRHALPGCGHNLPRRPIRLGLLQPGPCVLCAVADPSNAAPVLRMPGSLAETGRGLQIICALSDQWGYA